MDYLLENNPRAFLFGLDVGVYGSAFKTCKGLIERHGPQRVLDMPMCESALVGFALGASQIGGAADPRVPVRRFLDRGRHATRPERRHLVFPHRPAGAAAVAAALRRRADDGGVSLGRVRGALVAVSRA